MFREIRNKWVDTAEHFIRQSWLITHFAVTDASVCMVLRIFHFFAPLCTALVLLFGTKFWFMVVVLINICIFILFYTFEGCILSSLEHRFTVDDYTVIDPLLLVLQVELTKENREKYTVLSNVMVCVFTAALYYGRFTTTLLEKVHF